MKKRASFLKIIADAAIIACCALAVCCAVPTAFETTFYLRTLLIAVIPMALLLSAGIHLTRKAWPVPCVLFAIGAGVLGAIERAIIATGAKLTWYSAARLLYLDFSFLPTPTEPEGVLYPAACVTEFLIFTAAVTALAAAILLIKCKSPVPSLLLPVPAMVLGFIYTDCSPALYSIILLLIYWFGVIFGREIFKAGAKRAGLTKFVFLLLLAGLALLIPRISPEERFSPIPFSERRGILEVFGDARDRLLSKRETSPKEYDLTSEGNREENGEKLFSVSSSVPGSYLLRTHSYGKYSGGIWKAAPEYAGSWRSMLDLGATQSGKQAFLRVRDAFTNERLTPYGFSARYDVTPGESFIKANGKTAYVWQFIPEIRFVSQTPAAAENYYYKFAVEQYTLAKGPLKSQLTALFDNVTYQYAPYLGPKFSATLKQMNSYAAAEYVARIICMISDYTLTPGETPAGNDFIDYFLTQSHKGYCVHFASSVTAILQALDIPARYVIGYRVEIPEAEVWVDATRDSAHAWTEVFIRGVGWVPIECTDTFPTNNGVVPDDKNHPALPEATEAPVFTFRPIEETPEPAETPRPTKDVGVLPSRGPRSTQKPDDPAGTAVDTKTPLWWLLLIPAALIAWQGAGAWIRAKRKRSFTQKDSRQAVLEMLRYFASIRRYGAYEPEDPVRLANEASFSNHSMEKEQEELLKLVEKNRKTVCRHKPLKRFALKWMTFKL